MPRAARCWMSFAVPPEFYERVERVAQDHGEAMSVIMRRAVLKEVDRMQGTKTKPFNPNPRKGGLTA